MRMSVCRVGLMQHFVKLQPLSTIRLYLCMFCLSFMTWNPFFMFHPMSLESTCGLIPEIKHIKSAQKLSLGKSFPWPGVPPHHQLLTYLSDDPSRPELKVQRDLTTFRLHLVYLSICSRDTLFLSFLGAQLKCNEAECKEGLQGQGQVCPALLELALCLALNKTSIFIY